MEKALSGVDKKLYGVEQSLKDVNKLLKLDPTNTELLNQKQKLLQQSISETKNRLETLKQASEQAAKTAGNYDAWKEAYTPIQEEIVKTNEKMDKLKKSMKSMEESGQIDTEEYKKLQTEVDQSSDRLKELKAQKKQVDDEFGQPISPEGFDSLQREIVETEQKLKSLKETTGSASANLAKVSAVSGEFGNKVKGVGQSLLPVTGALTGVGAASTVMANNFNDAMSQAAGALDKPMSEMEDLRQLAIQTGQDTVFSATDAGNAITELAKGGLTEADIKAGALKTTMDLAASSGMDLGEAANVVVQAMGAFGLSANESAEAANALAGAAAASSTDVEPLTQALAQCSAGAKNAGWSIQETTAVLARFADAGIEGSDAGTSLKTMPQYTFGWNVIVTVLDTDASLSSVTVRTIFVFAFTVFPVYDFFRMLLSRFSAASLANWIFWVLGSLFKVHVTSDAVTVAPISLLLFVAVRLLIAILVYARSSIFCLYSSVKSLADNPFPSSFLTYLASFFCTRCASPS